jgi:hypothetical protein
VYSFIDIHIPHFLLDLELLHLLYLVWSQLVLLSGVMLHPHRLIHLLWHSVRHLLLLHAHTHSHIHWYLLLLHVIGLLHVYVDVNVWVDHRLILIRLVNYILVASRIHIHHRLIHLLLLMYIIVPESLLNLWGRCLEWHRFESLVLIYNRLIESFELITTFLILISLSISREIKVKRICLFLARGTLLVDILLHTKVQRKEVISSLLLRADLAINFLFLLYDIVKVEEIFILDVLVKFLCSSLSFSPCLQVELYIILRWLLFGKLPLNLVLGLGLDLDLILVL